MIASVKAFFAEGNTFQEVLVMRLDGLKISLVASCLITTLAFSWNINGTVVSSKGGAIQGATVTTMSAGENYADTTDANGMFSLEQNFTSIPSTNSVQNALYIHIKDNMLIVNNASGALHLSLLDALGKVYWETRTAGSGSLQIALPQKAKSMHSYLLVKNESVAFSKGSLYKVTNNKVVALDVTGLPTLVFTKEGYASTTYAMSSTSESGVQITMTDTTTEQTVCPTQKLAAGDYNKTISVNGVSRKYILHVPSSYKGDTAVSLVVDFHPIGGNASGESTSSPYKALTDPEGVITVYPDGLNSPNMGQAWNVQGCCTTADDTSFVRAVVKEVETLACINTKRIYAVGFSMGGGMSHYTACHLADIFAAVAPAAFDLVNENVAACTPTRPISVISFRSTGDPVVSYNGGYSSFVTGMAITFLGAKGTFAKWASINSCTDSPSAEDANGCSFYSSCKDGVKVGLCTKQGGGHDYGNANVGWPWLKQFTLP